MDYLQRARTKLEAAHMRESTTTLWAGTCCYEGCDAPSEWPGKDGNVCQEHWEAECDDLWWKYVQAFDPDLWLEDEDEYDTGNFDTLRDAVAWAHGQVGGDDALPQLP